MSFCQNPDFFRYRRDDDDEEEMADNFIEFGAAGSGGDHVKELPEIITPQHIDDEDLVTVVSIVLFVLIESAF